MAAFPIQGISLFGEYVYLAPYLNKNNKIPKTNANELT